MFIWFKVVVNILEENANFCLIHNAYSRMQHLNEKQRRELIVHYRENHPEDSNYSITKYFKKLGIPESTSYSILSRYAERGEVARAAGSGRPAQLMPLKRRERLVQDAVNSKGASQRRLACKYGISKTYVVQILHKQGVHCFKKSKCPKVTEKQKESQRVRIDRLYRHLISGNLESPSIVMDDESYFELNGERMPGNIHYYSTSLAATSPSQKFVPKAKFGPKLLVWAAISNSSGRYKHSVRHQGYESP